MVSRDLQLQGKVAGTDGAPLYLVSDIFTAAAGRLLEVCELIGADNSQPALPGIFPRSFFPLCPGAEPVRQQGQRQFRPAAVRFALLQAQYALPVIGSILLRGSFLFFLFRGFFVSGFFVSRRRIVLLPQDMQISCAVTAQVDRPQELVRCAVPASEQGQDISGGLIDWTVRMRLLVCRGLRFFPGLILIKGAGDTYDCAHIDRLIIGIRMVTGITGQDRRPDDLDGKSAAAGELSRG